MWKSEGKDQLGRRRVEKEKEERRRDELLNCSNDGAGGRVVEGLSAPDTSIKGGYEIEIIFYSQSARNTPHGLLDLLRRGLSNHAILGKVFLLARQVGFSHPRMVLDSKTQAKSDQSRFVEAQQLDASRSNSLECHPPSNEPRRPDSASLGRRSSDPLASQRGS